MHILPADKTILRREQDILNFTKKKGIVLLKKVKKFKTANSNWDTQ